MKMMNRSALRLRARPTFIAWCAQHMADDQEELAMLTHQLEQTGSVYLIAEAQSEEDFTAALANQATAILANELEAWCVDSSLWPEQLDESQLLTWFTVSTELMVFDLDAAPLLIADTDKLDDGGEIVSMF